MTDTETVVCPVCDGTGEIGTGNYSADTLEEIKEECPNCNGKGVV